MTSPISSNLLNFMTMASMSQAAPTSAQPGLSSMGGMPDVNSLFTMILNAAMQNMQQAQAAPISVPMTQNPVMPQTMGSFMPIQVTIQPLQSPVASQPVPSSASMSLPIDTRAVATGPADKGDFKFKPVQFIQLENKLEGKLSGASVHFINAGKKYDIDPNLLSAIAIHETGNGSSRAANEKNNVAGMMGKNGLRSYESIGDSIFDMARNLRQNYLNQGKDTISEIGAKYAPVGAANDPTGLNNHWTNGVARQFNNLA